MTPIRGRPGFGRKGPSEVSMAAMTLADMLQGRQGRQRCPNVDAAEIMQKIRVLKSEMAEEATQVAIVFLWSQGIRRTPGIPAVIRHLVPEDAIHRTNVLPPSRRLGGNPKAAEYISKHHEMLITCDRLGWRGARDILCDFAHRLTTEGKSLPLWLQQYLVWAARGGGIAPRKKRGRNPYDNVDRDFAIAIVVLQITENGGFRPTRNTDDEDDRMRMFDCREGDGRARCPHVGSERRRDLARVGEGHEHFGSREQTLCLDHRWQARLKRAE